MKIVKPKRQAKPRYCSLESCGIQLVRRPGETSAAFHNRRTCSPEHALAKSRQGGTAGRDLGARPNGTVVDTEIDKRFRLTLEEERSLGASELRRVVNAIGGFPSDGSRAFSSVTVYTPDHPDFARIAATVTPIDEIPKREPVQDRMW